MPLVEVTNLAIAFPGLSGWQKVVDGVSLWAEKGEDLGLVGASGSGKSLTLHSLLGLVPPSGRKVGGMVTVSGIDPFTAHQPELRQLRGGIVGLVMQNPAGAFNPVLSVGRQVAEAALYHGSGRRQAQEQALELLAAVGLEPAKDFYRAFPHQLSGGELQRALLASALTGSPKVLLLDEPTSALDPMAQNALLALLQSLQQRLQVTLILSSHHLALVARMTKRLAILATGETVEVGPSGEVLREPLHPAARVLCGLDEEQLPGPRTPASSGCRFASQCRYAFKRCQHERPALAPLSPGRLVRCFLHHDRAEHD